LAGRSNEQNRAKKQLAHHFNRKNECKDECFEVKRKGNRDRRSNTFKLQSGELKRSIEARENPERKTLFLPRGKKNADAEESRGIQHPKVIKSSKN